MDPRMEPSLYHLRTFHAVASEQSFTRAGRRLGLSQPAVSQHIRALEHALGGPLFETRQRRVYLTAAGEALYAYTQRVFNLLDEAGRAVEATRRSQRGVLRLAASPILGSYLLPPLLGAFKHDRPDVDVDVAIGTSRDVMSQVVAEVVPFGLVEVPVSQRDLVAEPIGQDEMVLVAPPRHHLARIARRRMVRAEDLAGVPLIRREAGAGTRALVDGALQRAGLNLPTLMELGSPEALKQAALGGVGIAWVSRLSVSRELARKELQHVAVDGLRITRALSLVYRQGAQLPPLAAPFLELVRAAADG